MPIPLLRPTIAEVDLTKLSANVARVRQMVGPDVKLLALVKANAYGHGAVAVSQFLQENKLCEFLGVASL
ncbi:MAG: alanine racemase, partial [Elusimicrobiaceae bacterium]|nr:alanine racemase [Elusimicrobiaceae bacterium]